MNTTKEEILNLMYRYNIGLFVAYDEKRKGKFTISQSKVQEGAYTDLELILQCVKEHIKENKLRPNW
jgi:hypothetical protein